MSDEERIAQLEEALEEAEEYAKEYERLEDRVWELEHEVEALEADFKIALKLLGMTEREWKLSRAKLELW